MCMWTANCRCPPIENVKINVKYSSTCPPKSFLLLVLIFARIEHVLDIYLAKDGAPLFAGRARSAELGG